MLPRAFHRKGEINAGCAVNFRWRLLLCISHVFQYCLHMDHLPFIGPKLARMFPVKLRRQIPYDNKGYAEFPNRSGFTDHEIRKGLLGGDSSLLTKCPSLYASLIQSWMYWGLLHLFLRRPVDKRLYFTREDGNDECVLHTSFLASELHIWARSWDNHGTRVVKPYAEACFEELRNINIFLGVFARRYRQSSETSENPHELFWAKYGRQILPMDIEISIYVLAQTLTLALGTVCEKAGLMNLSDIEQCISIWKSPPSLTDQLHITGLCPSKRHLLEQSPRGLQTALTALAFEAVPLKGSHYQCSIDKCKDEAILFESYQQTHVREGCQCSEFLPVETLKKMMSIVADNGVPVITVKHATSDTGPQLNLEISSAQKAGKYIAFSHVWADGRGNVGGNSLLVCQWIWLQDCVNLYQKRTAINYGELNSPPYFWIDTFCVPSGHDDRAKHLRSRAILSMADVYRNAEAIIVLDAATLLGPGPDIKRDSSVLDCLRFILTLKMSNWSNRVWTFHEGVAASRVALRTQDKVCDLAEIIDYLNSYRERKYHQRFKLSDLWLKRLLAGKMITAALHGCLSMEGTVRENNMFEFTFAWSELKKRKTSVPDDRLLVLALVNHVDRENLQRLQRHIAGPDGVAVSALQKLKIVLTSLPVGTVPENIIFHDGPRYPEIGMQWAPASLNVEFNASTRRPLKYVPGRGAIVKCRGWRIDSVRSKPKRNFQWFYVQVGSIRYRFQPLFVEQSSFAELCDLERSSSSFYVMLENSSDIHQIGLLVKDTPQLGKSLDDIRDGDVLSVQYVAQIGGYMTPDPLIYPDAEEIDASELWPRQRVSPTDRQPDVLMIVGARVMCAGHELSWCLA